MNTRYFVILALITVFFSLGCVSAIDSDNLNNITEIDFENNDLASPIVNEDTILENSVEDENSAQDEPDNIYVGTNTNPSGADGSRDNPYATLQDACSHIKNKESVTLKILKEHMKLVKLVI